MKKTSFYIGAFLLIMVIVISVIGLIATKKDHIILQGVTEATEVRVAVKIAGRVEDKRIQLGSIVKKGDTLMILSSHEIDAKFEQVNAVSDAANAQMQKANNGARSEQIQAALSTYQKAVAGKELAQKSFDRVQALFNDGVLPAQKRDEAETQLKVAKMNEEAAKAQYEMALNATRIEDKNAARAVVNQTLGAIDEVNAYKEETLLISPIAGEISQINAQIGELVTPGFPAISIIDIEDYWITFYVREDYLSKLPKGKIFDATFPALGDEKIDLKVIYIKPSGDFATWRATKATGSFDLKTFEVHAMPVNKNNKLRPGMSAIVNWDNL